MRARPLVTLKQRYVKAQKELQDLELDRREIIGRVQNVRSNLRQDVADQAGAFYADVANKVSGWARAFVPKQGLNIFQAAFSGEAKEGLVREIIAEAPGDGADDALDDLIGELMLGTA